MEGEGKKGREKDRIFKVLKSTVSRLGGVNGGVRGTYVKYSTIKINKKEWSMIMPFHLEPRSWTKFVIYLVLINWNVNSHCG